MHGPPDPALSPALSRPTGEGARTLTPSLSHPMGEGARRAGEGGSPSPEGKGAATSASADEGKNGARSSRTKQRLLITALATVLGALVGLAAFGLSPAILFGVMLGFLTGQTIHGLVFPASADDSPTGRRAWSGQPGRTTQGVTETPGGPATAVPGRDLSLALVLGAWGLIVPFVALLAQLGLLRGEGAGLVLMFLVLPVLGLLGLMGGSTASTAARRTLRQIEAGQRPEADRDRARLALTLSRLTTVALVAFLGWLLLRVNS